MKNETEIAWTPTYEPWRHGGWYVTNIRYLSGAVGCVSRNYPDQKWRIVCNEGAGTFRSRDEAARAERRLVLAERRTAEECIDCGGSTASGTPDPHVCNVPPCVASMRCYCAGHARGNPASAPCDTREAVCPRCLGIEPGTPGGTPEDRLDDTRFTPDLCDACKSAIDAGTARVLRGVGAIINLGDRWPWPMVSNARREGLATWFEVCERVSNDQRDCLPPLTLRTRTPRAVGFFTGEPAAHDERGVPVHAAHIAINGRHFVREVAIDQIDGALSELIAALTGRAS